MKLQKFINQLFTLCSFLLPAIPLAGQEPGEVLEITRQIADKVIRETSFETRLAPLTYNGGITQFSIADQAGSDNGAIYYATAKFNSAVDTTGLLGLSFSGRLKLYLNGKEIFAGTSEEPLVKEYTYNRYRFQHRLPVTWTTGKNEVLVKCQPLDGQAKVLMLPVDELDAKAAFVDVSPVFEAIPGAHWLISGPWSSPESAGLDHPFPPEWGFREFYQKNEWHADEPEEATEDEIVAWRRAEVPVLRELVIPETSSYTRDAYADWHYANGGTMLGILSLGQCTGDKKYLEFVQQVARTLIENDAYFRWQYVTYHAMRGSYHRIHRMTMLDDSGGPALPFAQLQLDDPGYPGIMPELERVSEYVTRGQQRLPDGTFCRPEPESTTIWADDLFMAGPFLLRMARITKDPSLYDEVALQVIHFNHYLQDPQTGLYFHGWYNQRQEHTPVRWGRANGWVVWATSEALMHLPDDHPHYGEILEIYRAHMKAIAGYQDVSGMWHQVLDHPETYEETSCTALFTLGLARGVRMGWLPEKYRERALLGWKALQQKILEDGTVIDICRGTEIGNNVDFYEKRARFDHDPRGLGAMITAGCEINLLLSGTGAGQAP